VRRTAVADSQCATIFLPSFPVDCFSVYIGSDCLIPALRVNCKKRQNVVEAPFLTTGLACRRAKLRDDDSFPTVAIEISPEWHSATVQ